MSHSFQINHFNWLVRRPMWQQMQRHRANMAKFNANFADANAAANSTMFGALSDQSSGKATLAAQAGLTRVQTAAKAAIAAHTKQIDAAQSLVNQSTVTSGAAAGTSATNNTGSVLDALA
jgi:hypothetical protein